MRDFLQKPNAILIAAILASVVNYFATGRVAQIASTLALIAWAAWSYDELAHGTNGFRRLLGAIVLGGLVFRAFA